MCFTPCRLNTNSRRIYLSLYTLYFTFNTDDELTGDLRVRLNDLLYCSAHKSRAE